ncbi:hypothetical protein TRFO_01974 [Tritrichomonas foetus]|uniref:Peptidase M60 domain-containing protein n=1 Tax=Tritrichomonas foetus TaxID=1144522 RepID=A0A1J4JCI3_9EUKA|nr:hypothetical protein TRFO_01974 [Tritrichomonas foetus]|eukprot:OHS96886.1 hypothetical protein TRFO_01974 [Tritrichomonas foetus]
MFLFQLLIQLASSKSKFAPSPLKRIIVDHVDTFEFLNEVQRPNPKHIKESEFHIQGITDNDYGWPGHRRNSNFTDRINKQTRQLRNFYDSKTDITQDKLYYHPAAAQQDFRTQEDLNNLPRWKARVVLNPYYGNTRVTPFYCPPGELLTFEFLSDEAARRGVTIRLNHQKKESDGIGDRVNAPMAGTSLNKKTVTWGFPYGGSIIFRYGGSYPIEFNVSGVIKTPLYQYGLTDENEFGDSLSDPKVGPITSVDYGTVIGITNTKNVPKNYQYDDSGCFWRSAYSWAQYFAPDLYNSQTDRIWAPNRWYFDHWVPAGAACAYTTANFNQFPYGWTSGMMSGTRLFSVGGWGIHHEMNHHHQNRWGYAGLGEMTNNVLCTLSYLKQTNTAAGRKEVNGRFSIDGGHCDTLSIYLRMDSPNGESEHDILMLYFGFELFQKYLRLCTDNVVYPENKYGAWGRHFLAALDVFQLDMLDYMLYFSPNRGGEGGKKDVVDEVYNKHPSKGKKFELVTCFYCAGYVRNGERIITSTPYLVNPMLKTVFNFTKAMKYIRKDGKPVCGEFEFHKFKGDSKRWKEIEPSVYEYTPQQDVPDDEFTVEYIEKNSKSVTTCLGILRQTATNINLPFTRYKNDNMPRFNTALEAYRWILEDNETTVENLRTTDAFHALGHNQKFVSLTEAQFVSSVTGNYIFGMYHDDRGVLYFSENPLTGDPDQDEPYIILICNQYNRNENDNNQSEPIALEAGKRYYANFLVYNQGGEGGGRVYFRKETDERLSNIPNNWFLAPGKTQEDIDWIKPPELRDVVNIDKYRSRKYIAHNPSKFKFTKMTNMGCAIKSNENAGQGQGAGNNFTDFLFDADYTTTCRVGWWPSSTNFPHHIEMDLNETLKFRYVIMNGCSHGDFKMIDAYTQIMIGEGNETEIVWEGNWTSQQMELFDLGKEVESNNLKVIVHNNSARWKDGHRGMTCLSNIAISQQYLHADRVTIFNATEWKEEKIGYEVNGRVKVGQKGSSYTFKTKKGVKQMALIGDIWPGMGEATIYKGKKEIGKINSQVVTPTLKIPLLLTSKAYMEPLYISDELKGENEFTVKVNSGEIRISGIVVSRLEDDPNLEFWTYGDGSISDSSGNSPKDANKGGLSKGGTIAVSILVPLLVIGAAVIVGVLIYVKKKKSDHPESTLNLKM